jgi:nicotinamide-nucleotide amidase
LIATIISIGDEILIGQVVNTNAAWLGDQLTRLGIRINRVLAIGDRRDLIRSEIESAAAGSDVVIVGGGLGPTHDDVTREAICDILGCDMDLDAGQLQRIEARFAQGGIMLNERSRLQAMAPTACRIIPNDHGSAPGLSFTIGTSTVYVLPGVPGEMRGIFTDRIVPELGALAGDVEQKTFLVSGVTESGLADELMESIPLLDEDVTLAYLPSAGVIRLRAMRLGAGDDARDRYRRLLELIRSRAERWIVGDQDETLAAALGRALKDAGLMLATAESCTGGLIGEMLTDTPGSSAYYLGGVVSYANSAKMELLGVPSDLLGRYGAVSREVAEAMAHGIRERLGAGVAISVTGIAGPDGGTQEKPVGTVWIGIASELGVRAERYLLGRERSYVRQRAANTALEMARREVLGIRDSKGKGRVVNSQ